MNILKIEPYDVSNGPGIRSSIWIAGCSHHCKGCWAPETWNPNKGTPLEDSLKEIEEVVSNPFIDGVSILGGDPLYEVMELKNPDNLLKIIDICVKHNKNIWLWTGYLIEDIPAYILKDINVVVEGPFIEELKDLNLKYRGSSNQKVIIIK